jgi:hypothetical protein
VFNPLRKRALARFAAPQDPVEMVTFGETSGNRRLGCVGSDQQGDSLSKKSRFEAGSH